MAAGRRIRWLVMIALIALLVHGSITVRRNARVRSLEAECRRYEQARQWDKLLVAARDWVRMQPDRREALRMAARAAKELREPEILAEFLEQFPRDSAEDVPWLSMLADLKFGPLNQPHAAAQTCKDILHLDPAHLESYQRLVFYYAMLQRHVGLMETVQRAAENGIGLPEIFVYGFLSDSLRLSNGAERVQRWLRDRPNDEALVVAYALHMARSLEGAVPAAQEEQIAALRRAQEQRIAVLDQLRARFPSNPDLLAYRLDQAVDTGSRAEAGKLLTAAPPGADGDSRFWRVRGWLFLQIGELDQARKSLDRAARLHPLDWQTRYLQADLCRRDGRLSQAESLHRLAVRGRILERDLLAQPNVQTVAPEILRRLAEYAADCGEPRIAACLSTSLHRQNRARETTSEQPLGTVSVSP